MGAAAWITGWLMKRFAPDAPGSGIPQVKVAYRRGAARASPGISSGSNFWEARSRLGRDQAWAARGPRFTSERPSRARLRRFSAKSRRTRANAVCAGSAAGLAAAFGSPLAGVTLVLEEIAGGKNEENFAGRSLLGCRARFQHGFRHVEGRSQPPHVSQILALSWRGFWLSPVVAVVAGSAGLAFQYVTLAIPRAKQAFACYPRPSKLVDWHSLIGANLRAFGLRS